MSHKSSKQPRPQKPSQTTKSSKPKHTIAGAPRRASGQPANAGKRWSLGASWDGFGVKAGLKLDARSQPNSLTTLNGPRFKHSEVIGTLRAPGAGDSSISVVHVFQPGMHTQFPWLANTAGGFQQYRVHSAYYEYEPFSSVFAAGGVQGRVSMFFDYAVTSPIDENIDDMLNKAPSLNTQSAVGARLKLNANYMIDNTRRSKNLRLDDQTISTNYDSFDAGRLIIGLDQFTTDIEFGKLTVTYDVEFLIPASQKIPSAVQQSALCDHFYVSGGFVSAVSGATQNIRSNWVSDASNANNVTLQGVSGSEYFLLEEGVYLVQFNFRIPFNALNFIYTVSSGLDLAGAGAIGIADLSLPSPATMNASNGNGAVVVSAGGAQGILWPTIFMNYLSLALSLIHI